VENYLPKMILYARSILLNRYSTVNCQLRAELFVYNSTSTWFFSVLCWYPTIYDTLASLIIIESYLIYWRVLLKAVMSQKWSWSRSTGSVVYRRIFFHKCHVNNQHCVQRHDQYSRETSADNTTRIHEHPQEARL
jgi:hypothetical protein